MQLNFKNTCISKFPNEPTSLNYISGLCAVTHKCRGTHLFTQTQVVQNFGYNLHGCNVKQLVGTHQLTYTMFAHNYVCVRSSCAPMKDIRNNTPPWWQMCNKSKLTLISHADKPYHFAIFVYTQCFSCFFIRCHEFNATYASVFMSNAYTYALNVNFNVCYQCVFSNLLKCN